MVPRALGAAAYGNYSFLSAFFGSVLAFADSGSSLAYYNKLSQRPAEAGLSAFYARFAAVIFLMLGVLIAVAFTSGAAPHLWPNLSGRLIVLAALMVFGNWLIAVASKAVDANALTGFGEAAALLVRLLLVSLAAVFFVLHLLSIQSFLALQTVFNFFLVAALVAVLARRGHASAFVQRLGADEARRYGGEFWEYCHPILTVSFAVLAADVLDRWLLQRLAGPAQQGFLGLGLQVGAVVFIFGGATASLLTREFAQAHYEQDLDRLRTQFMRYLPRAYAVTAYFGMFLAVQAPAIVRIFGGEQFAMAAPATAILCLYPLHQVYGQFGNSLLYATGRTKTVRSTSIAGLALGLLLTVFFLTPRENGGLGLGAVGIAAKMVLHQVIGVNVILWLNTRYLGVSYRSLLAAQVTTPIAFGVCAVLASVSVGMLEISPVMAFLLSGVFYSLLASGLAWRRPSTIGFNRADMTQFLQRLLPLV